METDEYSSTERKTWQVYSFGKRNAVRFDLKESREGFCCVQVVVDLVLLNEMNRGFA